MNEKTDLSKIKGNLNKAEIKLLNMAMMLLVRQWKKPHLMI